MRIIKGKYNNPWLVKLFIVCLIAIPLVVFAIFVGYGNFGGIIEAFKVKEGASFHWGLENFRFLDPTREEWLFKTDATGVITGPGKYIINSFGYLFVYMFISVPISIGCSFFLYKKVPFSKLIVVLLFLPNIVPLSVLGLYYRELVANTGGGVLFEVFKLMGMEIDLTSKAGNLFLYIYTVYFGFGYNAILIWGAMTRIPEEVVESANLDGANLLVEFFNITVPMSWSTMSMVIVLSWMVPFTVYTQPQMIIGGFNDNSATWALYIMEKINPSQGGVGESNTYIGSALSVFSACFSLPTTLLLQKALEKVYPTVEV